mmetsp:Transcript_21078/g.39507  ORF Transcript_21078/g.39507 Transcript_21078/m.39507 type:complete len:1048 (-) Transcript_21078:533-3676(-)
MALPHHDAAHGHEGRGGETELLSSEQGGNHDVAAGLQLTVRLQLDAVPQIVQDEGLLGLGESELPRQPAALDSSPGSCSGTSIVSGDDDMVSNGLGDSSSDDTNSDLRNKLDRDLARGLGVLQVVDKLSQILDRVDVVVRRRGDEADAGSGSSVVPDVFGNLEARKLSPLARLGALGHLDLNLVRVGEVVGSDAEASTGDLLDGAAAVVLESQRILSSLSSVRASAKAVHGDGKRLVRLLRNAPQAHGAGDKALDDVFDGLDLVQRDLLGRVDLELELTAQRDLLGLGVGQFGEGLVGLAGVGAAGNLEVDHRLGGVQVSLLAVTVVELAVVLNHDVRLVDVLRVGRLMEALEVREERVEVCSLDTGGRSREATVDDLLAEPDSLEDLGALVGLQGGDAHLTHDLQQALGRGLSVGGDHVVVAVLLLRLGGDQPVAVHLAESLVGDVRADAVATEAEQGRKVVDLASVSALREDGSLGALLGAQQVLVHSADGKEGRDGNTVRAGELVTEDDALHAVDAEVALKGEGRLVADPVESLGEALRPGLDGEGTVNDGGAEHGLTVPPEDAVLESPHFLKRQDGLTNHQAVAVNVAGVFEHVAFWPNGADERHDQLLPDGVDRGVGNLGEELLEVVGNSARLGAKHSESGVVTHAAEGLLAADAHREQEHLHGLRRVPKHVQAAVGSVEVELGAPRPSLLGPVLEVDGLVLQPLSVGALRRDLLLDLVVRDDPGRLKVDEEHLSGLEAVLDLDVLVLQLWDDSDLRREHDMVVLGDVVPGRSQPIAVERRPDVAPVGEGDHRGSVPGLHDVAVVLVKVLLRLGEISVVLPRFGDHHHDTLGQAPVTRFREELQDGVKVSAVGHVVGGGREELGSVVAEVRAAHNSTAGVHPVLVAAEGVDLSVVAHHADGLGALPGGEGVGGEARVNEGEVRLERGIPEVQEVLGDLLRGELPLVRDGLGSQGVDVEAGQSLSLGLVLGQLPDPHEFPLEELLIHRLFLLASAVVGDEDLLDVRLRVERVLSQHGVVGRHSPPANHTQPGALDEALQQVLG